MCARAVFVGMTYTSVRKDTMDARPRYLCVSVIDVRIECDTLAREHAGRVEDNKSWYTSSTKYGLSRKLKNSALKP